MRYIIGIDLGTTNSSVCYVDCQSSLLPIQHLRIPQLVSSGYVDALPTLASCCYLCAEGEWPEGSLQLPWKDQSDFFVGRFAQMQGAKVPTRLVQSAKSWLCHKAADRRERILPFEAANNSRRLSPIEASARYLSHIREAWNYLMAKGNPELELEQQEIVLTVPASFDEVARTLTAEAAKQAGLQHLTLLEEPQAAFYAWLSQHEDTWHKLLPLGSSILICDVGGGTTDFSLIEVSGSKDKPQLQRMAVGDHLLLGGDNMDAAIAHFIEPQLFSEEPSPLEWMQLRHQARLAKEALFDDNPEEQFQMILQGIGSSVVRDSRSLSVRRDELHGLLLEGFFKLENWADAFKIKRGGGIRTMGLPYENEPSITKHLAHFIKESSSVGEEPKKPDFVLFNGGAMKPMLFRKAIIDSLKHWFQDKSPALLSSASFDLAVGRGAAYYGKVRRGLGVKVGGGSARGYYLGIDVEQPSGLVDRKALTLLPRGCEDGANYEPQHTFLVQPNQPAAFQLYSSHVRLNDHPGDLIEIDEAELQPLPQVKTILCYGKKHAQVTADRLPVHLSINLNAIGTLELALKSQKSDHRWSLEFQLRTAAGQDNALSMLAKGRSDELLEDEFIQKARSYLPDFFSQGANHKSEKLMESLEAILEKPRREWPSSALRSLWEAIPKTGITKLSAERQLRWWNLAGFLLRPGFGYPLDDFRLKVLWKVILSELNPAMTSECRIQKWICYRRIAGGLNKGQQLQIAHELMPSIFNKRTGRIEVKGNAEGNTYAEKIRALASMELIEMPLKVKLGDALVRRIDAGEAMPPDYWALGRIGARHLFYGSAANVVPKAHCIAWVEALLHLPADQTEVSFVLGQLAHKTDQRELNMPSELVARILQRYPSEQLKNALSRTDMSRNEQEQIFGEQLPFGLLLKTEGTQPNE